MKEKVVEQPTRRPYEKQYIKVYTAPGETETCIQPAHCTRGFGRAFGDDPGCYPNQCLSTDICKRVKNQGLRWEYVFTKLNQFAKFFKEFRQRTGLTLRQFCLKYTLNPGNISRLERGLLPPPISHEKLEKYASFLQIEKGTDEWYEFLDRAATCIGRIPVDIIGDEQLVKKLPLVFRTLRGQKVPKEQLNELVDLIRKS